MKSIFDYYKSIWAEKGDQSVKRNIAWRLMLLLIFVQVFSLIKLTSKLDSEELVSICKFYSIWDGVLILLILGITSVEKIQMAIRDFRGIPSTQPPVSTKKETLLMATTETETT